MKKFLLTGLVVFSLSACNTKDNQGLMTSIVMGEQLTASGPLVDKSHKVSFESVRVSTSINAEIINSNRQEVLITAPESIMDKVLVDVQNGRLHIAFKPGTSIRGTHRVSARIYTNKLSGIAADSSADIVIQGKFTQEQLNLSASSSGSIEGDVEANELSIEVSSSGDITSRVWARNLMGKASSSGDLNLSGTAKNGELKASSSGSIDSPSLVLENAVLRASSSGDVRVGVSHKADASASSSGGISIVKKGTIELTKETSSSGSVSVN